MSILDLIQEEINISNYHDDIKKYEIDTDLGVASILVGHMALSRTLQQLGMDDDDEKDYIFRDVYKSNLSPTIRLISWKSTEPRNGFGTLVLKKLFDLGETYNIDRFIVSLQSADARNVLTRFVDKGYIEADPNSMSGVSVDKHPTIFKLVRKPK